MNISDELVEMLRLELGESKLYSELGQAGVNNIDDVIMKNLRRINIQQHKSIDGLIKDNEEKNVAITGYTMFADEVQKELKEKDERIEESANDLCACLTVRDQLNIEWHDAHKSIEELKTTIDGLIAELSARKEDSKVLMEVVGFVKELGRLSAMVSTYDMRRLRDLLVDYLDVPEILGVNETEPQKKQMGTRIICADEVYTIDDEKMEAVRDLIDCGDRWVVYTDDVAVEVANQRQSIDEHHNDLCEAKDTIENQKKVLRAYRKENDEVHDKLDKMSIDLGSLRAARDRYHNWYEDQHHMIKKIRDVLAQPNPLIDEIAKIIQED